MFKDFYLLKHFVSKSIYMNTVSLTKWYCFRHNVYIIHTSTTDKTNSGVKQ